MVSRFAYLGLFCRLSCCKTSQEKIIKRRYSKVVPYRCHKYGIGIAVVATRHIVITGELLRLWWYVFSISNNLYVFRIPNNWFALWVPYCTFISNHYVMLVSLRFPGQCQCHDMIGQKKWYDRHWPGAPQSAWPYSFANFASHSFFFIGTQVTCRWS